MYLRNNAPAKGRRKSGENPAQDRCCENGAFPWVEKIGHWALRLGRQEIAVMFEPEHIRRWVVAVEAAEIAAGAEITIGPQCPVVFCVLF